MFITHHNLSENNKTQSSSVYKYENFLDISLLFKSDSQRYSLLEKAESAAPAAPAVMVVWFGVYEASLREN